MVKIPTLSAIRFTCFKGDESFSQTLETVTQQQSTAGAGGAAIGAGSTGNIINITSSDVNALEANQNVSETALNDEASTAAYSLEALEQSQANSNVVVAAALSANTANADTAIQTAQTLATQSQELGSQALAGGGYGQQYSFPTEDSSSSGLLSDGTTIFGISLSTWALLATIAAGGVAVWAYFRHHKG